MKKVNKRYEIAFKEKKRKKERKKERWIKKRKGEKVSEMKRQERQTVFGHS